MHEFCKKLFINLDRGLKIDNLVLVNGMLNDAISSAEKQQSTFKITFLDLQK